ncbi:helix-turn-helix domain-containing protein [Cetobacterium sp. SF1]|uniref:helix-turn-helix domain-containing protein n=1 Tax=unclassified Cetobacterium TaxID=2630983 RepID=UPI003CEE7C04
MIDLNIIIGNKLKKIRNERNMSLDDLASITGVSKAMLSQIENGKSNPTVSTLWKISTSLKISFSFFIEEDPMDSQVKIIDQKDITPIIEADGKMNLFPIFPYDTTSKFEVLTIELKKDCFHQSPPHNSNVEEYIIVTQGILTLEINGTTFNLQKGNSLKFIANTSHSYKNIHEEDVIFQNIIFYKN